MTNILQEQLAEEAAHTAVNLTLLASEWCVDVHLARDLAISLLDRDLIVGELSEWPDENGHDWLELANAEDYSDFVSELRALVADSSVPSEQG